MIGRAVAVAYVATVAGLTAAAYSDHEVVRWEQVAAAVLTLPTLVAALPVVYVLGGLAWTLADSPGSGSASSADPSVAAAPIWPVTLTFTVLMTLVACANVALVRWIVRSRRGPVRRTTRRAPTG
jgi:ABC-type dipeptide/oligopeptide/nickel transport system permease subunit